MNKLRPAACRLVVVAERHWSTRRDRRSRGQLRARAAGFLHALHRPAGRRHRPADRRGTTRTPASRHIVGLLAVISQTFIQVVLRGAGGARTHDRRIMRSTASCTIRASCTDGTGYRIDGSRCAGIIRRAGPRTGPRVAAQAMPHDRNPALHDQHPPCGPQGHPARRRGDGSSAWHGPIGRRRRNSESGAATDRRQGRPGQPADAPPPAKCHLNPAGNVRSISSALNYQY